MKFGMIMLASVVAIALTVGVGLSAEKDPTAPRVPPDQMAAAKAWKNSSPPTPQNIAKGKEIFNGKGACFSCHGTEGRGDGPAGATLNPAPRNFHNPKLKAKSDGEFRWVILSGIPGTGMISYSPALVPEEEIGLLIVYMRSLHDIP